MSIQSNVGLGVTDIGTTDTALLNPADPYTRQAVSAFSLHNTTVATITVTIYESPDLTSASGDQVAVHAVPPGDSVDVVEVIGQGYAQGS